ncbi:EmrB/QacA subfamily drug resistance transporter [Nocardia transvalensis]|uniref:EmrB/QacA subfamily drug resistance transporter n=1 Tax=Nocardia transvalensis TaxID=37333 RepID=A0A7W9PDG7_9NOCA|nr:MFS transporter [Nocardia transvalensis]MBB5914109.1 EmrB/QacA subfamily drug resistance transporter [Nocardia transvalensis]
MTDSPTADSPPLDPRRWIAFAVVLAAGFMDLLDVTIVNVAVPSVQKDLNAAYSQLEWIVAAYVLSFAAVLITGGRLGDIYGRKRIFIVGMAGFTLASLVCGLSGTPAVLIGSRFVQGAFAGLMVPQILATIRVTFPKHERAKAIAIYSGVGGSASAVGLSLGGLLVQWNLFDLTWRPIFLVNVPVGIVALIAAAAVMQDSRSTAAARLDVPGMALAVSAVLLLVYPLTEGRRLDWPAWTFVMMAAAAVTFGLFVGYERRRARTTGSPLIDLDLFRSRPFAVGLAAWLLFWIALGGFFLVWTLFMQGGLGWTPMRAGLTAVSFAVGAGIGAGTSVSALTPRFGRLVLLAGGLITAAAFVAYGWMAAHYEGEFSSWQMIAPLVVAGAGFGTVVAPTIDLLLGQVPEHEAGAAAGLLNTGQQLGMALGVALVGIVFFTQLDHDSARGVAAVAPQTRADLAAQGLPGPAQDEILANFGACVRDRSAQADPSAVPDSCRSDTGTASPAVAQTLSQAGEEANAVNFAHTFYYTLGFGGALLVLVGLGFLALPRDARLEQHEPGADSEDELVGV